MSVRELDSAPRMRSLYPKAAVGAGRSALRRLPGLGGGEPELPDLELRLPDVEIDREHLTAYDRVCGFTLRDTLPATYPHVIAFPLAMEVMTDSSFPFPVIGMVHIENRIEQLRPIAADERLSVRVWVDDLRPHDRGTQFHINAEAEAGGDAVWRSVSTYLHREGGGSSGKDKDREREEPPKPSAIWKLDGGVGRRYAEVSGDRNPIHMHGLTAKLFGMPRPIAHGMWLKARCLAALEGELPESFTADVRFKLPVFLHGNVAFATWTEDGGREFALHDADSGKPHLTGSAAPG
jgi:acyl dehydratase